jgi:ornithine cyclodeaminase/alanine dehydrogenase-like protein (mu-crystallin family)
VTSAPDAAPGSAVNYLLQLMDSHQLTELRTTYNGTYGASLLFQTDKLTYFVALFHDKVFWRVIQTYSEKDAESIYRTFAAQTEQLAEVDIDALRLQAGKKYAEHMVAMNEQRLQNLQQDAARQQQQAQEVMVQQQQAKQQAVTLSSDLRATSNQLDAVQQHIRVLETQQNNPELILPAPTGTAAPNANNPSPAATPGSSSTSQ